MLQVVNPSQCELLCKQSENWTNAVMTLSLGLGTWWGSAPCTLPFPTGDKPNSANPNKSNFIRSWKCLYFQTFWPRSITCSLGFLLWAASRRVVTEGSVLSDRWVSGGRMAAWGLGEESSMQVRNEWGETALLGDSVSTWKRMHE